MYVDHTISNQRALDIRRTVIEIIFKAQASHLGSSLSVIEILTGIYSEVDLEKIKTGSRSRDKIILSKGHAAAALYSTLYHFGLMTLNEIYSYHQPNSFLQGHVSHGVPYVEHSTGALGHGLSVGVGHAIAQQRSGANTLTFVICGDGEVQEGAVWEALMYARTVGLGNLVVFVDDNKISSITNTLDVINYGPIHNAFSGFDLNVHEINGHDLAKIKNLVREIRDERGNKPHIIICNTIKGKGISFAESQAIWHYKTLSEEEHNIALGEL